MCQALRQTAIAEQQGELVGRSGAVREEVPHVLGLLLVRVRVVLLRVDEVGKLDRVVQEEHRRVVTDEVVVALSGVELDGEAARIASRIRRAARAGHGAEPDQHLGGGTDTVEQLGAGVTRHVVGDDELPGCTRAAGVHDALRDAFAVEAGQLFEQVLVLGDDRAELTRSLGVLVVDDGGTGFCGELLGHGTSML
jgi:hypothetical protein